MRCPRCKRQIAPGFPSCPHCNLRRLDVDGDLAGGGALTRLSMGRNALARSFGNIFFIASLVFVVIALFRAMVYPHVDIEPLFALVVSGFLLFCAYEVWAFTHGRTTSIDSRRHEATPDRTGRRVFGLLLDLAFWCLCVMLLKSW